jgi:hypothetical protein
MSATDGLARSTVWLVGGLYVACTLLQRFAVPGLPVPLLLPLVLAVAGWAFVRGILAFDRGRLIAWLLATGATALVIPVQSFVLQRELVSVGSWALFMAVWTPFTLRLVDRRLRTYVATLRVVVAANVWLAGVCIVMMASQYAGLPYRDWLADVVPGPFLLDGFVITYPISYDSPIYRANAWIGLEPSMISLQLGVGMVASLLIGSRVRDVVLLTAGLLAATSGSGLAVVAVGLVVLLATSARQQLRRFALPMVGVIIVGLSTPMGQSILTRLTEGRQEQSSTSLRAIAPYRYLWPTWSQDLWGVLLGFGPGSAQGIIEQSGVLGLLVPTPVKVFFEYGLLPGTVLAVMMLLCYVGGPSRAISVGLLVSLWTLQPGTTTLLVLVPLLTLVSWWSPRPGARALEDLFTTAPATTALTPEPTTTGRASEAAAPRSGRTIT